MTLGNNSYDKPDLILIIEFVSHDLSDGLSPLARELIAAKLNIANGAAHDCIDDIIADAEQAIGNLVPEPVGDDTLPNPPFITNLIFQLSQYNKGNLCCAGHCSDRPGNPGNTTTTISFVQNWPNYSATIHCVAGSIGGNAGMYVETTRPNGTTCVSFIDCPMPPGSWADIAVGDPHHGCTNTCSQSNKYRVRQDTVQEWGNQITVVSATCGSDRPARRPCANNVNASVPELRGYEFEEAEQKWWNAGFTGPLIADRVGPGLVVAEQTLNPGTEECPAIPIGLIMREPSN